VDCNEQLPNFLLNLEKIEKVKSKYSCHFAMENYTDIFLLKLG